jgi:hypothetical protein
MTLRNPVLDRDALPIDALPCRREVKAVDHVLTVRAAGRVVATQVVAAGPLTRTEIATGAAVATLAAGGALTAERTASDRGIRDTAAATQTAKRRPTRTDARPDLADPTAAACRTRRLRLTRPLLATLLAVLPLAPALLAGLALAAWGLAPAGFGRRNRLEVDQRKRTEGRAKKTAERPSSAGRGDRGFDDGIEGMSVHAYNLRNRLGAAVESRCEGGAVAIAGCRAPERTKYPTPCGSRVPSRSVQQERRQARHASPA